MFFSWVLRVPSDEFRISERFIIEAKYLDYHSHLKNLARTNILKAYSEAYDK